MPRGFRRRRRRFGDDVIITNICYRYLSRSGEVGEEDLMKCVMTLRNFASGRASANEVFVELSPIMGSANTEMAIRKAIKLLFGR